MRINSITVRNYRIHRELKVELDPSRTVIGGLNECGKSTLAEAAHRALFLKAKITGEAQRNMVSAHGGHPEVEVCFETGGKIYQLSKRFSGQTGSAKLSEIGGMTWPDEIAEEQLAKVLGVELAEGGKGAGDRVVQQWAHLWVWQGQAGSNPTDHANAQRDTLTSRLQTAGSAAMMQSELDARVAQTFTKRFESVFNQNGSPKTNSDLGRAAQKEQDAVAQETKARENYATLQQTISDYEQAGIAIETADNCLKILKPQKEEAEEKIKRVEELRNDERLQSIEAEAEAVKHRNLSDLDQRIKTLREDIQARTHALQPKIMEITRLKVLADGKRLQTQTASAVYETATEATRGARLQKDLAAAYEVFYEKSARQKQLAEKTAEVRKERQVRSELESELAKLPTLDDAKLKKLRKMEIECSNAEAALNAIGARIELISSKLTVKAGDTTLLAGQAHVLTDATEVAIGTTARLRVSPGGGTSLAEARENVRVAQSKLSDMLAKLGLASLDGAVEALAKRDQIQSRIHNSDTRLNALGAESIDDELSSAQQAFNSAQGELEWRKNQARHFVAPDGLEEANKMAKQLAEALQVQESSEKTLKEVRDKSTKMSAEAEEDLVTSRGGVEKESHEIEHAGVELGVLLKTYGKDEARSQELARLMDTKTKAENRLLATRSSLIDLQPDLLNADKIRLEHAIATASTAMEEARTKLAVAKHWMSGDGTTDPAANLVTAEKEARSAKERLANEQRRAGAIQLLHQLFLEEQKTLSEQITQPLVRRVSGYLQCLFGVHTQATIVLEEKGFKGLSVTRSGQEFAACEFDRLSGGAREQVAAAFRLAMAEILAEVASDD